MSGSTVGGVLGAVVGSFFGAPQLGWMIGSMIGGVVAPEKIHGPKLTDARSQTAQDGVPRTYGYGTFPCTGNLIWVDPTIHEHKKKEKGKGGPTQITYTYTRSYAIAVCRGPIEGYLIIKRNGKIVYDARTDAELSALGFTSGQIAETRAAQSKFEQIATFYYGDETQTADATITAVKGVGNAPAYRGTAYIVCTDDDVTELQGAVPQYEFVVRECGTTTSDAGGGGGGDILITSMSPLGGAVFATAKATASPEFVAIPPSTGADLADASASWYGGRWVAVRTFGTLAEFRYADSVEGPWHSAPSLTIPNNTNFRDVVGGDGGWMAGSTNNFVGPLLASETGESWTMHDPPQDETVIWWGSGGKYYTWGEWRLWRATDPAGDWAEIFHAPNDWAGETEIVVSDTTMHAGLMYGCAHLGRFTEYPQVRTSPDGGASWPEGGILVSMAGGSPQFFEIVSTGDHVVAIRTNGEIWTSANRWAAGIASGAAMPYQYPYAGRHPYGRRMAASGGRVYIADFPLPRVFVFDPETLAVTGPFLTPIATIVSISASTAPAGVTLPDAPGHSIDHDTGLITGPGGTTIEPCDLTLGEIVAAECAQRDVTDIDVSELTDAVIGFRVSSETSPQTNIQSLQSGFMFDGSEYDGVLHFPKRGGPTTFALTVDDLAARDGDPIEWERAQEAELLRKVTVGYIDPATTYTTTTQDWERRTGTIQALGEGTMELPVVQDKDWAKQAAEKSLKVGWAETDTCRFSLTRAHSHLVPAQVGTITDADGVTYRIRITRIEDDGGVRLVEAKRERSNTYNSNAQGTSGPNPSFPGSSLRGPTDAVVMNMPVLRDEDDKPGVYWAARGYLSGWQGAVLQVKRGSDWVTLGEVSTPATMGELLADLPAHAGDVDDTNTLTVKVNDDLASVTFHELLSEKNALAIVNADGTVEVVQVQTWTETAPGEWTGTTLIRGRLDTQRSAHAAGSRVVVLDSSVRFAHLQGADLGKTLTFRAVSVGTNPDAAPTFTVTLATMESQREWQPYSVSATKDDDCQWRIDFIGRHRLGTDALPVASAWFKGWRVSFTLNGVTKSHMTQEQTFLYTTALQEADWGQVNCLGYAVTVSAINEYTGADGAGAPINPGPSIPSPPAISPSGAPASTTTGPNGGFPDNAPYPVPEPTTFGTDVIDGGDFASPGDLANWRNNSGAPLDGRWSIVDGRLCFFGTGTAAAFYWPARRTLAQQILPHYSFDVHGVIECDAGAKGSIGVGLGFSTTSGMVASTDLNRFGQRPMSVPAEYGEPTTVSHAFADRRDGYNVAGNGQVVLSIVAPAVLAVVEGPAARVYFDDVAMEIAENAPATTPATLTNLDFASGLSNWVQFPPASSGSPSPTVSGGEVTFTPVSEYGVHKYLINESPITGLDALDKWVRLAMEVNCDDPTVFNGMTRGGVGISYAIKLDGNYNYTGWANPVERGDWTERVRWMRQVSDTPGATFHVCLLFKCAVGYRAKARNLTAHVTTAPIT